MKKNNRCFFKTFFFTVLFITACFSAVLYAEENAEILKLPVTREWMNESLQRIEMRLAEIEARQIEILEGQKKLSEEHTQLRHWVHRN